MLDMHERRYKVGARNKGVERMNASANLLAISPAVQDAKEREAVRRARIERGYEWPSDRRAKKEPPR